MLRRKYLLIGTIVFWTALFFLLRFVISDQFNKDRLAINLFFLSAIASTTFVALMYKRSQDDMSELIESLHDIRYWMNRNNNWFYKNFRNLSEETKDRFVSKLAFISRTSSPGNSEHMRQNFKNKDFIKAIAGMELRFVSIATYDLKPLARVDEYFNANHSPLKQVVTFYDIASNNWGIEKPVVWSSLGSEEISHHGMLKLYLSVMAQRLADKAGYTEGCSMLHCVLNELHTFNELRKSSKELPAYASTMIINVQQELFERVYRLLAPEEARIILNSKIISFEGPVEELLLDRIQGKDVAQEDEVVAAS